MKPFFSIIIPVYNVAPYLRECLDSVLAQTFADWEAVCIDDGSDDGSGAILDEYATKNGRFRVVHQTNRGVSHARNCALDLMQGDWVCFLDGDDAVDRDWLENYGRIIVDVQPDYVHIEHLDWRGGLDECKPSRCGFFSVKECASATQWLWKNVPTRGFVSDYAVRRDVVGDKRFPCGVRYMEDSLFAMSWLLRVKKCVVSKYDGYFYRKRNGSAVSLVLDSAERSLFVDAVSKTMNDLRGRIVTDKDIAAGCQQFMASAFFSWVSNSDGVLLFRYKRALRRLAVQIDPACVKPRWRWMFSLFRDYGILSPLFVSHCFALGVAKVFKR